MQIDPTRENFRIWIENAGVRQSHYESIVNDARQIAAAFTTLAEMLEGAEERAAREKLREMQKERKGQQQRAPLRNEPER